jgi:hypothetical protein
MEISIQRLVAVIACMASEGAEVIEDIPSGECYVFIGRNQKPLPLDYEEVDCLISAKVLEVDGGCDEKGHETVVYRLTETAIEKVVTMINEEKKRREGIIKLE